MDLLDALDIAGAAFGSRVREVGQDDWAAPTPCPDWDVHFLIAHVVGGNRFASMVLSGWTADDAIGVVLSTPQLGDDVLGAFEESVAEQRDHFREDGAMGRSISHPVGDITGERFLGMRVFDLALHAWDLATALGLAADLDDELVGAVLGIVAAEVPGMGMGIEPSGSAPPTAVPMDRLLDLSGRGPSART